MDLDMKNIARYFLGISVALLAGCGGSLPPIDAPGAMPQSRAIAQHGDRAGSPMLAEAKGENHLYVGSRDGRRLRVVLFAR
jgi:hypothetical protein